MCALLITSHIVPNEMSTPHSEIESMMKESRSFPPAADFAARAHVGSLARYEELYRESVSNPDAFWARLAAEHRIGGRTSL